MKIQVIINHESRNGNGRLFEQLLRNELGSALVEVCETRYPRHATDLARQAVERHMDTVVVVGGDGTVNEVINGLAGTNVALGIIPAGTANDLASPYNLPIDPKRACRMFLQPEVQLLDVLEVNGWRFVTGGGVGLPSEVAQVANLLKGHHGVKRIVGWFLGSRVYVLALVMALLKRTNEPNPVVLRYDGKVLSGDYLWLMVENQPVIGKRFILSPGAVNTDGLFDICLVDNHKTKVEILSISRKVTMGEHVTLPSVTIARSHEMEMKFEKPVAFFGDGEEGPKGTDFQIKVLPRSLKLITGVAQEEPRTGKLVAPDASESLVRK